MKRLLGVNVDHVATLRQMRGTRYPDPVAAASFAEEAGADQITIHLREDRRHIQDQDARLLRKTIRTHYNLEMALSTDVMDIALEVRPDTVTIVPEKRQELTTEGGLDLKRASKPLSGFIPECRESSISVSLFLEPDEQLMVNAKELGADAVELHTGRYAETMGVERAKELRRIAQAADKVHQLGMRVVAGHGLNYENIRELIKTVPLIEEYNIGHSIIARAVFVGLAQAVREMKALIHYERGPT